MKKSKGLHRNLHNSHITLKQRRFNVIQRQDIESTLNRLFFNVMFPLGESRTQENHQQDHEDPLFFFRMTAKILTTRYELSLLNVHMLDNTFCGQFCLFVLSFTIHSTQWGPIERGQFT